MCFCCVPTARRVFLFIFYFATNRLLLCGISLTMSHSNDKMPELWQSFMPRRKEIKNNLITDLFCQQIYDKSFEGKFFNPKMFFEKWEAIEVTDFDIVPDEMETYALTGGLYAVFIHKGVANTGAKTFSYIFETWLPASKYVLDNRPHFELLGEKYKIDDPPSEEEVWIPIKLKL